MTWRARFAPIVRKILEETREEPYTARRARLREAFPGGSRVCWPYKVWLDEIRVQLGHKKKRKGLKEREGAQRRLL